MNDIREDLKAFVDGELNESRRLEVSAAIQADPKLEEEVRFIQLISGEIKSVANEAPIQGASETLARLRRPRFSLARLLASPFGAFAASATVVIVAVVSVGPLAGSFSSDAQATFGTGESATLAQSEKRTGAAPSGQPPASFRDVNKASRAKLTAPTLSEEAAKGVEGKVYGNSEAGLDREFLRKGVEADKTIELDTYANRSINGSGAATTPGVAHRAYKQPKLVRTAEMSVRVQSVHEGQSKSTEIAKKLNGFVANTSLSSNGDQAEASLEIRVPVENFEAALIEIRALGPVEAENSKSEDVTAGLADQESRIVTLADIEKNLVNELAKTKNINEKYQLRRRIEEVRVQRDSVKAQYAALRDIADYSTINLKLLGRPQGEDAISGKNWSDDTWTSATNSARSVGRVFGAIGMYLVAYAPMWIPLGVIVWLVARKRAM